MAIRNELLTEIRDRMKPEMQIFPATTTDATPTDVVGFTVGAGEAYTFDYEIQAIAADGTTIRIIGYGSCENFFGTGAVVATSQLDPMETTPTAATFAVTTNGDDVNFTVTGVAGVQYDWAVAFRVM